MLTMILKKHPAIRGVIFDLDHVHAGAKSRISEHGLTGRCETAGGDFFAEVPAADAYIMKHIIHDWSEEKCLTILRNCREAMRPDGRILIVETVLPAGDTPHQGKLQDLVMLLVPGGQERSEKEYEELLGKAGFRLRRVVPTTSVVSIVEGVPG